MNLINLNDPDHYPDRGRFLKKKEVPHNLIGLALTFLIPVGVLAQDALQPVNFSDVKIQDVFWAPRIEKHALATLPICIDQIEMQTPRIRNFEYAAKREGKHLGRYYDDSDVYKVLEGMAYALKNKPDPTLEKKADEWIEKIANAQQEDGYINTYYTLHGLEQRWTDMEKHEMYCAGHLIEAGIAYFRATGKRLLLDVSIKMADHIDREFGPGKKHWVTGHEEIELALVKLFYVTGEKKYVDLAQWLLDERGKGLGKGAIWDNREWGEKYCQDNVPLSDITDITGHAVRAMYLYTGMADVAAVNGNKNYTKALDRVWEDVVERNMYITGGIGSSRNNEGFTEDYDLPNDKAYCETCASIGMIFWNQRMFLLHPHRQYIDVLERSLYNAALDGVSLSGDRFFYENPLFSTGDHHRKAWYGTACCPSNISRLLPSLGGYGYAYRDQEIWVNLFMTNEATLLMGDIPVVIQQKTDYPWSGNIELEVQLEKPKDFVFQIRVPAWCEHYTITARGKKVGEIKNGYVGVKGKWKKGDKISVQLEMEVKMVAAHPKVLADQGKRALQRGPLIYCVEEEDNKKISFEEILLSPSTKFKVIPSSGILNNITLIEAQTGNKKITLIPYYAWDNRSPGKMEVWINYKP